MESGMVVLYPSPGIGHLVSMVELGKLIHTHHPSLSVTIFITPAPFETGSTEKYIKSVSTTTPSITFHQLPSPNIPPDFSSEFIDLAFGIPEFNNPIVEDTLITFSKKSPIKAVVLDFFSNSAFNISTSLKIPTYYFYTSGASGLCAFLYLTTIHNTISESLKDVSIFFDIPGVPRIHSSHLPMVWADRETNCYKQFIDTSNNMAKCSGLIANTFVGLEQRAVEALREGKCVISGPAPPVYFFGPLIAGGNKVEDSSKHECLKWLNSQPSKSVVFLCFGSQCVFTKEQLKEIAIGLERSEIRFLWVVRDSSPDDEIFPDGFLNRIGDKGLVVRNWAPQVAILSHDSVSGFVSHGGWNSVLEAVVAGVPMVAWPLYAEQKMNRVYLVEEIKVALAVDMSPEDFVTAEGVEKAVRELMEGEEGRVVREWVLEMSGRAKAAVEDGGSSNVEFLKLIQSWTKV